MSDEQQDLRRTASKTCARSTLKSAPPLERITSQPPLARSHRLSKFLAYIVDETLAGRSDRIGGYAIGIDVFDKPESFDPRIDTNVRVEASRLRRRLSEYYAGAGSEDPVEIVVPKGQLCAGVPLSVAGPSNYGSCHAQCANAVSEPDRGPSIAVLPFENYSGSRRRPVLCRWPDRGDDRQPRPVQGSVRLLAHHNRENWSATALDIRQTP